MPAADRCPGDDRIEAVEGAGVERRSVPPFGASGSVLNKEAGGIFRSLHRETPAPDPISQRGRTGEKRGGRAEDEGEDEGGDGRAGAGRMGRRSAEGRIGSVASHRSEDLAIIPPEPIGEPWPARRSCSQWVERDR